MDGVVDPGVVEADLERVVVHVAVSLMPVQSTESLHHVANIVGVSEVVVLADHQGDFNLLDFLEHDDWNDRSAVVILVLSV